MDLSDTEAPEIATFRLVRFHWRFGKLFDQEGEFRGVTLEITADPLPWLKIRLPFFTADIFNFHNTLGRLLEDETPEKEA